MNIHDQTTRDNLVLAVHPTSRGFGWVLFERSGTPLDWSVASARRGRSARLISRFERILRRYEPSVLVVEEGSDSENRSEHAAELRQEFVHLALLNGMDVTAYPQHVVAQQFSHVGATTKHEIAVYIARRIDAFSHCLPKKRRAYDGEQHYQALFDAAALALTYFAKASDAA